MSIPFPVELAFGDLRLSAHAILEVLAFFSGYRYYQHLRSKTVDAIEGHHREILRAAINPKEGLTC